jgi:hypothetical protein
MYNRVPSECGFIICSYLPSLDVFTLATRLHKAPSPTTPPPHTGSDINEYDLNTLISKYWTISNDARVYLKSQPTLDMRFTSEAYFMPPGLFLSDTWSSPYMKCFDPLVVTAALFDHVVLPLTSPHVQILFKPSRLEFSHRVLRKKKKKKRKLEQDEVITTVVPEPAREIAHIDCIPVFIDVKAVTHFKGVTLPGGRVDITFPKLTHSELRVFGGGGLQIHQAS